MSSSLSLCHPLKAYTIFWWSAAWFPWPDFGKRLAPSTSQEEWDSRSGSQQHRWMGLRKWERRSWATLTETPLPKLSPVAHVSLSAVVLSCLWTQTAAVVSAWASLCFVLICPLHLCAWIRAELFEDLTTCLDPYGSTFESLALSLWKSLIINSHQIGEWGISAWFFSLFPCI